MKTFKFGKHAPQFDYRTLKLGKYIDDLLLPPDTFDNLQEVYRKLGINDPKLLFPIDGNDRLGDCTIAGIAHAITVYNGLIGNNFIPREQDVIKFYNKMTCHRDIGCNELEVLKRWRSKGFTGDKPIAFVGIDPKNHTHIKQSIQLFGGVYLGFQVQQSCLDDFNNGKTWDVGPLLNEGHAVYAVAYDKNTVTVLTWGNIQKGTWAWWDECVDEAYAILPTEAKTIGFAPGFDIDTFQKDLSIVAN